MQNNSFPALQISQSDLRQNKTAALSSNQFVPKAFKPESPE